MEDYHKQTYGVEAESTGLLKVPCEDVPFSSNQTDVSVKKIEFSVEMVAPDGGWGWIVCLGSFVINFILDGTMFSFGVLMLELQSDLGQDKSTTSWIGSTQMGIHMCMGPLVSILLARYSIRQVVIAGSLLAAAGFLASVFAPNVYFLILTYGVISGIGIGMIFLPALIVLGLYFTSKRAIATGVATSGSGVGTFVYAYLTDILLDNYRWRGTILVLTGLLLNSVACGMLFKPLLPQRRYLKTITATCTKEDNIPCQDKLNRDILGCSTDTACEYHGQIDTSSLNTKDTCRPIMHEKTYKTYSDQRRLYKSVDDIYHELPEASQHNVCTVQFQSKSEPRLSKLIVHQACPRSRDQEGNGLNRVREVGTCCDCWLQPNMSKTNICSLHMLDIPADQHHRSLNDVSAMTNVKNNSQDSVCLVNRQERCKDCCHTFKKLFPLRLFKNKIFVLLVITFTMWTAQGVTMTYLADLALSMEISRSDAAFLISIVGITNVLGRLISGFITDCLHIPSIALYFVAPSVAAIVNLMLPFCGSYLYLQLLSAIYGLCMAVAVSMRTIVLVDQLGVRTLTESFGIVALFQGVAFVVTPPIAGKLITDFKSFGPPFLMAASMYAISGLSALAIGCLNHFDKRSSRRKVVISLCDKRST